VDGIILSSGIAQWDWKLMDRGLNRYMTFAVRKHPRHARLHLAVFASLGVRHPEVREMRRVARCVCVCVCVCSSSIRRRSASRANPWGRGIEMMHD